MAPAVDTLTSFAFDPAPPALAAPQFPAGTPAALADRFRESFTGPYLDWLANPPYALFDGAPNLPAGLWRGASGTVSDRRGGKDLPQFWSEQDLRGYRVMSRWLWDTNPFMIGFGGRLVDYTIGDGFQWQACKRGQKKQAYATGSINADPLTVKAQNILDEFRDRVGWPLRAREGFRRFCRDGEVAQRFFKGDRGCGPDVRWINSEQIGSPTGNTSDADSFGVRVAVHDGKADGEHVTEVYVRDHDGNGTDGEWLNADRDDPAARVLFHTKNTDADVKRGLPDSFSVHESMDECRKLVRNMVVVACAQSAIAWMEKFPTASIDQVRALIPTGAPRVDVPAWANGGGQSVYSEKMAAGTVLRTEGSREFAPGPITSGVASYVEAEQAALRMACVRWGFPPYMTAKADDVNFASSITAGSPFAVAIKGGQTEWAVVERASALKVLDLAVESGLLTWGERRQLDVEVIPPTVASADPGQETQRNKVLFDAKVLDPYTWMQREGLDPSHVEANWKAWRERNPDPQQQPAPAPAPQQQPAQAADPFGGPSLESVVVAAVARLLEDKAGLVKKQITDKDGVKRTVYVSAHDQDGDDRPDHLQGGGADGPPREHVLNGLADLIAAADPEVRANPKLMQRIGDAALTAAAKAYGAFVKLAPHIATAQAILEGVFDTPSDAQKFGYSFGSSGSAAEVGHGDPLKNAIGINTHLAANIASHVLGRAWVYAVGKMKGGKAAESDGIDAIAAALREAVAHVAAELGLPEPPDVATIAAALRKRAAEVLPLADEEPAAESVSEETFAALVAAGVWVEEAQDRSHLTRVQVTDKTGVKRWRWVRRDRSKGGASPSSPPSPPPPPPPTVAGGTDPDDHAGRFLASLPQPVQDAREELGAAESALGDARSSGQAAAIRAAVRAVTAARAKYAAASRAHLLGAFGDPSRPPIACSNKAGPPQQVEEVVSESLTFLGALAAPGRAGSEVGVRLSKRGEGYWYDDRQKRIVLPAKAQPAGVCHEYGHHLESLPGVLAATEQLWDARFGDQPDVRLGKNVVGREDKTGTISRLFPNPDEARYVGRRYPSVGGSGRGTELLSHGLELLYSRPVEFAEVDPEWFRATIACLRGERT